MDHGKQHMIFGTVTSNFKIGSLFVHPRAFESVHSGRQVRGKKSNMNKGRFSEIINREIEVAFSKHSQPVWFRILKYVLLGTFLYFFWDSKYLWPILLGMFALALLLHFWYRHKTQGWTKSYGMWKHDKDRSGVGNPQPPDN